MAKDKNSFVLYANYLDIVNALTNEQAGELFKLILAYVNDLNPEEPTDVAVKIAYLSIKSSLKADLKRYEAKCEQNRKNVNKRYERKQTNTKSTNVYEQNSRSNSYYDIDIDIDNDIESDIDIELITIDNIEEEKNSVYTPDYIIELINIIEEKYPEEFNSNTRYTFEQTFQNLISKYTEDNIKRSTYHSLQKTLEKDFLDNPMGYLRNAIYINCEQFKQDKGE